MDRKFIQIENQREVYQMKEIRKTKAEQQQEIKRVFRQIPDFYSVAQQYKTL